MTNETAKPKRRWYQFSLRTLVIVVTLSTVPLCWVGWKLEQGRRERAVIAWIEEMGGAVEFEDVFKVSQEKSWWGEWTDKWLGESVWGVHFERKQVSNISPLAELKSLEELNLHYSQVSDLSPLSELKSLKLLWLSSTQVSDLSPLAELKNLEVLFLFNTKVSDLSPLAELKSLKVLRLSNTQVNDLSPLAELEKLEYLNLDNTQVSDEQVQKLRKALPNCDISHSIRDEE